MNLNGEQLCLSVMAMVGIFFEREREKVAGGDTCFLAEQEEDTKFLGALNSYFHNATLHTWYAQPHFHRTST